jgi:hypothetical protein
MTYVSAGIAGVGIGTKIIGGIAQKNKAQKALAEINKTPAPDYSTSPEMQNAYNRAQAMSSQGFTSQENAGFNQDLAMQNNAQQQNAIDIGGGNLASTIGAGLQSNNIQAINQRAGQGAQLKRSNIQYADQLAGQLQSQQNLINQQKIARRQMLEGAYGQASAQASENIWGAVDSGINVAGQAGATASANKNAIKIAEIENPKIV